VLEIKLALAIIGIAWTDRLMSQSPRLAAVH
jgi:hypothetical protein